MSHRTTVVVVATALLVGCAGNAEEDTGAVVSDEQAVDDIRAYFETHYNMHHADMVASVYADSAWALPATGGYLEGRAAIQADLGARVAASPTVRITSRDVTLVGGMGASMGSYSVTVTPQGGESMTYSGSYLNVLTKASGEWKILGEITNYDAAPPEGWTWADPMTELPADEGTMTEVTDYYATHWNMGHPSMVADTYTDDAMVSFSDGPILQGRAAVEAELTERAASGVKLTIHDVGTLALGDGWAADGGWYQVDAPDGGGPVSVGSYLAIMQQQADGSWKIHRQVTNARPVTAM